MAEKVITGMWNSGARQRKDAQRKQALADFGLIGLPTDREDPTEAQRRRLDECVERMRFRGMWSKDTPREQVRSSIRKLVGEIRRALTVQVQR
jgi:hypothetical protein